jgi:uncharacterized protein YggL (DUF469 family)
MRKRLRKKLKLKEFRLFGFSIKAQFSKTLSEKELDEFWDYFILDVIEKNGLEIGGGFNPNGFDVFASDAKFKNNTTEKYINVKDELSKSNLIKEFSLGKLIDAIYDDQ